MFVENMKRLAMYLIEGPLLAGFTMEAYNAPNRISWIHCANQAIDCPRFLSTLSICLPEVKKQLPMSLAIGCLSKELHDLST